MYDVVGNTMRYKYTHKAAVLDCCFSDSMHIYSGGLDKGVSVYVLFISHFVLYIPCIFPSTDSDGLV